MHTLAALLLALLPISPLQLALPVAAELRPGPVAVISWPAMPGAWLACAIRVRPGEDQLIGCAESGTSEIRLGPGSVDGAHRLVAGDLVEVRVWDGEGVEVARGLARVAWRQWLPLVAAGRASAGRAIMKPSMLIRQ